MDPEDTYPTLFDDSVVIHQPTDLETGDTLADISRKQLPYLNGLLMGCHMSLASIRSHREMGTVINNSLKVMKAQRELLGVERSGSRVIIAAQQPIPYIPD